MLLASSHAWDREKGKLRQGGAGVSVQGKLDPSTRQDQHNCVRAGKGLAGGACTVHKSSTLRGEDAVLDKVHKSAVTTAEVMAYIFSNTHGTVCTQFPTDDMHPNLKQSDHGLTMFCLARHSLLLFTSDSNHLPAATAAIDLGFKICNCCKA